MKIRLTSRDLELIEFLGKYNKIKGEDCKKIYKSIDYHRKRLKVLEKGRYIKRENKFDIKIDVEGRKVLYNLGYDKRNMCRNKDYQDRLNDITKIAMLSLGSNIEFTPSWELKDDKVYTDLGRKYIGELKYQHNKYVIYYISNRNSLLYTKQILNDINKLHNSDKVIVFLEDFKLLNKKNKYFMLENDSLQIINPTKENLNLMQLLEEIDIYDVLREMYNWGEILLADYEWADYMVKNYNYIINMPFIDTKKLDKLRKMNNSGKCIQERIDIITLSENTEKIREIIGIGKFNIVELDKWIEYMKEQIRIESNLDKFFLENYGI